MSGSDYHNLASWKIKYDHSKARIWILSKPANDTFCVLILTFYSSLYGKIFLPVGVCSFQNLDSEMKPFSKIVLCKYNYSYSRFGGKIGKGTLFH